MPELATRVLEVVKRYERNGSFVRITTYYLCQDVTSCGNRYLYIKCIESLRDSKGEMKETFAVAGACGADCISLLRCWKKICSCTRPVRAVHLGDVVSDESFGRRFTYGEPGEPHLWFGKRVSAKYLARELKEASCEAHP